MSVHAVSPLFLKYLTHFGLSISVTVVCDGYASGPSIKDNEHDRRLLKVGHVAPDRQINNETRNIGNQESFFSNINNKMALITLSNNVFQYYRQKAMPTL